MNQRTFDNSIDISNLETRRWTIDKSPSLYVKQSFQIRKRGERLTRLRLCQTFWGLSSTDWCGPKGEAMTTTLVERNEVRPVLVYWHCDMWWPLADGPACPMEHDTPIYDDRPRRGRKRRVWMCAKGWDSVVYFSRAVFLSHDENNCYAE